MTIAQIKGSRKYTDTLYAKPLVKGNIGQWQERHMSAVAYPARFEQPIIDLLQGWLLYADEYLARYGSEIGNDYVLGDYWERIGDSIRNLLNGDCGRLDCGTLDAVILNALRTAGINVESK